MKRLILSLTLLLTALFVSNAMAEKPEKGLKSPRPGAAKGRLGPQRDPAQLVARIMTEFDQDGDEKLDKTELTAWLQAMQQRRGEFLGRGKPAKGKSAAAGKRQRSVEEAGTPGGEKPQRPAAE